MNAEEKQALIEHIETDLDLLRNVTLKYCHEVERECVLRDIKVNEIALAGLTAQPIGRVDRGEVSDSNEYPDARVICLHEHVGWESFQDGTELFTRPAPAADLVPIGRVDRGEVSDNNEYPNARVVCLHDQADWENFPDGTELFLRPAPAVGMDNPEPYAWLVHAPQGDYVERNPEVVANLEGTGLTKCKPLYLDL
ncbi:hypothetical protein [Pantoea agglomerans]|uniref:hypothetical protein n=1 Tax=Enterobacter agglomerans TaxID=549 RepID=UPI003DA0468D